MNDILRLIFNVVWFVTAGLWLGLLYFFFGILLCIFIITIPFGVACFRIGNFVLWPFGREVIDTSLPGGLETVGNVIWFIVAGVWLAFGHIMTAIAQALTIIGLPLAWANLKLIPITCFPFGKEIIRTDNTQAQMLPIAHH